MVGKIIKIAIVGLFFLSAHYLAAAEMQPYSIPQEIINKNQQHYYGVAPQQVHEFEGLQIILLVDRSGSQKTPDVHPFIKPSPGGIFGTNVWTRWDNTLLVAHYLSRALVEFDTDKSVPVIFFDDKIHEQAFNCSEGLLELFSRHVPTGGTTNLLGALKKAFKIYNGDSEKKVMFIVITDGQPDKGQEPKIKKLIKEKLTKKDPEGITKNILFIQIGDDNHAGVFLRNLDNAADIGNNVDTKKDDEVYMWGPKYLLHNAIYEHLEKE